MRDFASRPDPAPIKLPERLAKLDPFARALVEANLECAIANLAPCVCCGADPNGIGLAVFPPDVAVTLGAPPGESVAIVYHLCSDCSVAGEDELNKAVLEAYRQRKDNPDA